MSGDEVRIWADNALGLWMNICPGYKDARREDREHYGLARSLGEVVRILRARGWFVRLDHEVDSLIRFHHRAGINPRSGLEATVKLCGRNLAVEFFQNTQNVDNSYGGRYDSNKFERMTYVQKLEAVHLVGLISERLSGLHDCPIIRKLRGLGVRNALTKGSTFEEWWEAEEKSTGWHYRPELGRASYTNGDRDRTGGDGRLLDHLAEGWTIRNGRWVKGTLYYNLNNMWILKISKHSALFGPCWEMRATRPEVLKGRRIPPDKAFKRVRGLMKQAEKAERYGDVARYAAVLDASPSSRP